MVKLTKMQRAADLQFSTISKEDRKKLGITKTNFRKEFAQEMKELKKKRMK